MEDREKYLKGNSIEPIKLTPGMSVKDLVKTYGKMGFNAKRLAEACELFKIMVEEDATICLTLSGAMTPVGLGGAISTLMENGFIDWIISTGANLYHDMHLALDLLMKQGHFNVDDNELYRCGIERIYDVFITEETLLKTDKFVVDSFAEKKFKNHVSTADLHHILGKELIEKSKFPEKSFLANATKYNVPIYTSSPGDSSIGMNVVVNYLKKNAVPLSVDLDVLETAAIVRSAKKNGVIEVGGGSPKNFFMQTQPMLWQILNDSKRGHDFFIQITTDSPQWGGLSGATPSEAKSWGKVKDAISNNIVVYCDATIAVPILFEYILSTKKPRKRKELYLKKDKFLAELKDGFEKTSK
jgi:deoxyhypusine synthase